MPSPLETKSEHWLGVDLDCTLAIHQDDWPHTNEVGPVIPRMRDRVMRCVDAGTPVRLLTARAGLPQRFPKVRQWLSDNDLPQFPITNVKDFGMIELWDDRAREVLPNTGVMASELLDVAISALKQICADEDGASCRATAAIALNKITELKNPICHQ